MKNKIPAWVWLVLICAILTIFFSPIIGIVAVICILLYMRNHKMSINGNSNYVNATTYNSRTGKKTPPKFIRKLDFISSHEVTFSHFSKVRFIEENGSQKMVEVENPKNGKIYIRLNDEQFDVYIECNQKTEQLSFEKENIKILDISNHQISIIEGNNDHSYMEISYENQYFTPLEVSALIDFFKDFRVDNNATKYQEEPIVEPVTSKPKEKKPIPKVAIVSVICTVLVLAIGITAGLYFANRQVFNQESIMGNRTTTITLSGLSYQLNTSLDPKYDYSDSEREYHFSNKEVPYIYVMNEVDYVDYTKTYDYSMSSFENFDETYEDYYYYFKYDADNIQKDFLNLENGKWYHMSGILDKNAIYQNDSNKKIYLDVYAMPTNKSLVQVAMIRAYDDTNDYDIQEFLSSFDFSDLFTSMTI